MPFHEPHLERCEDLGMVGSPVKPLDQSLKEIKRDRRCSSLERKGRLICILATIYHVWRVHNECIFYAKRYSVGDVVRRIKIDVCWFFTKLILLNLLGWS